VWDAIGGHVESRDSIHAALVRELAEEIQVTPSHFVQLATLAEIQPALHGEAIYHIFLVTAWDGNPTMRVGMSIQKYKRRLSLIGIR
jgi:ADP-ribose pyrophosphatase YjhB (NUDIX family)